MGGGALLTPALIALGIPPTAAVANDLVAAAATKTAGAVQHWRNGHTVWPLVGWLTLGSVPGALAGARLLYALPSDVHPEQFVKVAIGWTLALAAALYALRSWLTQRRRPDGPLPPPTSRDDVGRIRPLATIAIGLVGGLIVGFTSVGAGSIMMTALLFLHPRIHPLRLVGTDLVQATPLVFAAAIGHIVSAPIDWVMVTLLLLGGVPGALIGARLTKRVPVGAVRSVVIVVLAITGVALAGPAALAIVAGAGVAALVVWLRRRGPSGTSVGA